MMHRARLIAIRGAAALQSHRREQDGASMVEYVLIVSLIAMVAVSAVYLLGQALDGQYSEIADSVVGPGG